MQRHSSQERPEWKQGMDQIGFTYHSMTGGYWREDACYQFTSREIDELESATESLQDICLAAVERIITEDRLAELGIPESWRATITHSWEVQFPSLYGRFDLAYDGEHPPKLLEYNADTPTALLEASVAQWHWFKTLYPAQDQFNSLHEELIRTWGHLLRQASTDELYFTCMSDVEEDFQTCQYLADTAYQAGWRAMHLPIDRIGWDSTARQFVDQTNAPIRVLFKLYPWEWLYRDAFAVHLKESRTTFIEPPWKVLLSHKGILALLWRWFPDHPHLLPASFEPSRIGVQYVKKPFFSREGANVTVVTKSQTYHTDGPYGAEGYVYQSYAPLPDYEGQRPVIGSWVVGKKACGIGIREDSSLVHGNRSAFVPHYFLKDPEVAQ